MKNKLIVITGCSSAGKSTLIDTLNKMGYTVIPKAGHRSPHEAHDKV